MTERTETEISLDGLLVVRQADWAAQFPRLAQGLTTRALGLDFGLRETATGEPPGPTDGWSRLLSATRIPAAARCRQVHGAQVAFLDSASTPGVRLLGEADALVTRQRGVLLAITIADCVPVFIVDGQDETLGLAHAGWRGTAAGVVERTLERMETEGSRVGSLHIHLGTAICKKCYEIGPEVTDALGLGPGAGSFLDLRGVIRERVLAAGVPSDRVTASRGCTRCEPQRFFSYRGGDRGQRMCAFLGWQAS
jgi:YfiH family protein